jgi:hypothetical protein
MERILKKLQTVPWSWLQLMKTNRILLNHMLRIWTAKGNEDDKLEEDEEEQTE